MSSLRNSPQNLSLNSIRLFKILQWPPNLLFTKWELSPSSKSDSEVIFLKNFFTINFIWVGISSRNFLSEISNVLSFFFWVHHTYHAYIFSLKLLYALWYTYIYIFLISTAVTSLFHDMNVFAPLYILIMLCLGLKQHSLCFCFLI